jgi:probable phosphoglycerate mutase
MRLLLLRHGQTHGNTAGALDTAPPGLDLTDLGRRQAEAAARAIVEDGLDAIFVSPLVRTHQTAEPFVELVGVEPCVLEGIREISAGDFEMKDDHDSILGYIGTVADWIEERYDTRMPGGETGHEFLERYDAAVAEIAERLAASDGDRAVLISHGAAMRTWISARVPGVEAHAKATDPLHNTACIEIAGHPESGWEIVAWHSDPVGGCQADGQSLDDVGAPDPTGQGTDEAADAGARDQVQN